MDRTKKGTFKPGISGNPRGRKPNMDGGWASALTGIGTALHDKRTSHRFSPTILSYQQCTEIYEGDDLGRRAASGPVEDAFRQGYEISISDEGKFDNLKEDVEDRLRELNVDKVLKKALTQKRALGGAAILIGVRDNKTMDRPLDRKAANNIEFLSNLEPADLTPHSYYDSPVEPKFGQVKLWQLTTSGGIVGPQAVKTATSSKQAGSVLVHESRLIIFNQTQISKYSLNMNPAGQHWGLSIYTQIYDILRDFNIAWSAAGLLITDFSQAVFSIENLSQLVMRDEDRLRKRMQAMEMGRSVARAVLIDTNEKFDRQSTNLSGLPELLLQLSRRFAASIDTPLSVLMGGGEKSDQSTMGDDLRYYYDKLSSLQRDELGPVIHLFVEIIMRGLRQRKLPKKWCVKWHPLWQLTDEQKANARLAQARVDAIYIAHGVLDPETVARVRFGGEYSFETSLANNYEAPGFMALPPVGVLVEGKDPKTGLPPGEQPAATGAVGVAPHARNAPRHTSKVSGGDKTAGGAVAGSGSPVKDEADDDTTNETSE